MNKAPMLFPILFVIAAAVPQSGVAQLSPSAAWAAHAPTEYQVFPNLTYLVASNYEVKLDIYQRRGLTTPQTDDYLHAWRVLGRRHEGSVAHVSDALVRDGLERGERGVPSGACGARARRG